VQPANDFIAAARTNATGPFMGRVVLTTLRDFTMSPWKKWVLAGADSDTTGADCKESLLQSQPPATMESELVACCTNTVVNITIARRKNALALFQDYAEKALASGVPPRGLEQAFAAKLQISPSMWSQIKSARPIGDKLARQIEILCGRSTGWLDESQRDVAPTPAEVAFLELALTAWRSTNGAGRKALREHLKTIVSRETSA